MPNVKTVGLFPVDVRLYYVDDVMIISDDTEGTPYVTFKITPTPNDWIALKKKLRSISMEMVSDPIVEEGVWKQQVREI